MPKVHKQWKLKQYYWRWISISGRRAWATEVEGVLLAFEVILIEGEVVLLAERAWAAEAELLQAVEADELLLFRLHPFAWWVQLPPSGLAIVYETAVLMPAPPVLHKLEHWLEPVIIYCAGMWAIGYKSLLPAKGLVDTIGRWKYGPADPAIWDMNSHPIPMGWRSVMGLRTLPGALHALKIINWSSFIRWNSFLIRSCNSSSESRIIWIDCRCPSSGSTFWIGYVCWRHCRTCITTTNWVVRVIALVIWR